MALTITPDTLPDGTVGVAYTQTLVVTSTFGPPHFYTWGTAGVLPPGISFARVGAPGSDTSRFSGTPTTPGIYSFTVAVFDDGAHAEDLFLPMTLTVGPLGPTLTAVDCAFVLSIERVR